MLRYTLIALALSACTAGDNLIPSDDACAEQADAWCTMLGFAGSGGCRAVYAHDTCRAELVYVSSVAQDECIGAIDAMTCGPLGCSPPSSCTAMWR